MPKPPMATAARPGTLGELRTTILLATALLLAGVVALSTAGGVLHVWRRNYQWAMPGYLAGAAQGPVEASNAPIQQPVGLGVFQLVGQVLEGRQRVGADLPGWL